MPYIIATKNASTSKLGNGEKVERYDHHNGEEYFDENETTLKPSRNEKREPLAYNLASEWMTDETIPVDSHDRKLEQ